MITNGCFFFDLDGTIIDIEKRYYAVHIQACKEFGISPKPQKEYWHAKREKIAESQILSIQTELFQEYDRRRIHYLEDEKFLALDTVFPGAQRLLEQLNKQDNRLFVATMRRNTKHALAQIKALNLFGYFTEILSQSPGEDPIASKTALIQSKENVYQKYKRKVIVGDTEIDILCGKRLGFTTIAVSQGIRTPAFLKAFHPDYLIDTIARISASLPSDDASSA